MEKLLKIVAPAALVAVVIVVLVQRSELGRLEQKVEALSSSTRVAAQDGQQRLDQLHNTGATVDSQLSKRVAALEQTVARMFGLLLGKRGSTAEASQPADTSTRVDNLREDVDALLTGAALDTTKGREQLHEIVKKVQQQQREQRRQRWRELRSEMVKERLKKLAQEASLSGNQLQRLTAELDTERTQRRSIIRSAHRGEKTMSQAMTEVRALRDATDTKIKQFLDDQQFTSYEKMRKERRGLGRRWMR